MNDNTEEIKKALLTKRPKVDHLPYEEGLSTGSTLLNLACTGRPDVGFLPGHYYLLVGDSGAGKTWLAMTSFAEASINSNFNHYRLIFDNAENGALMDVEKYFGEALADRLEPPGGTREDPKYSSTAEEFYYYVDDALNGDKPFVYLLDSMDALTTDDEEEKFSKKKSADRKGTKETGSYGTSKAKINSSHLRVVYSKLRMSKSILIVISQTRENIGFDAMFTPKTRGGGKALTFYATLEWWLSISEHISCIHKGNNIEQGVLCKVRIKKNRIQGKDRTIEVPILHNCGIDDIGANIDFLLKWKHWEKEARSIVAPEFSFRGLRDTLIDKIQEENLEVELSSLVEDVWDEIESSCTPERKNKYRNKEENGNS